MFFHQFLTAWLTDLDCRTVNRASRTSLITNSTSSGMWASASQASWWVKQWKHTFFGGWWLIRQSVAWGWALFSADHRDDLQYGALLCHPQQQRGHLRRGVYSTTIIHPGTRKVTIIKKVPSCNQLTLPEFTFVRFFFPSQHSVKVYVPCCGDSMISATNVTIFHIYDFLSVHSDTSTNLNPHTVWVVSTSFRTASIVTPWLWETSARESTVRTSKLSSPTHAHTHTHPHTVS